MPNAPKKINRPWVVKGSKKRLQDDSKFYNSWKWRKFRKSYLERNPVCVMCEADGIVTPAQVVDHIIPMRAGGAAFDEKNLQSLCRHHHDIKSGKDRHGIGKQNGDRGRKRN